MFNNSFNGIYSIEYRLFSILDCTRAKQLFASPNKECFIRNNPNHLLKHLLKPKEFPLLQQSFRN